MLPPKTTKNHLCYPKPPLLPKTTAATKNHLESLRFYVFHYPTRKQSTKKEVKEKPKSVADLLNRNKKFENI